MIILPVANRRFKKHKSKSISTITTVIRLRIIVFIVSTQLINKTTIIP